MKKYLFFLIFLLAFYAVPGQQVDTAIEQAAIKVLIINYENAWNRHDAKGLAAQYDVNATWVNWFGAYYKGRADIEQHYASTHAGYFKTSTYYTRAIEDISFLAPDIAVAHVRTGLSGDERYPGQVFEFRRMIVLTKKEGTWHIQDGQNAKLEKGIQ